MQQQAAVMTFDYNRDPQDLTFITVLRPSPSLL